MKNIKKKIDEAMISMSNKGAAFARENPKKVRSIKRYAMFAFCLGLLMSVTIGCPVFAEADGLASSIAKGLGSLWDLMKIVGIAVAAIGCGVAAFQFFLGGEKGVDKAKKSLLYTAIGVGVLFIAPLIVKTIKGWVSESSSGDGVFTSVGV